MHQWCNPHPHFRRSLRFRVLEAHKMIDILYRRAFSLTRTASSYCAFLAVFLLLIANMESATASCQSPSAAYNYLKHNLSPASQVILANESNLTNAAITQRWNVFDAPAYILYAKPASNEDVKKIVDYAAAQKIPFLAIGGGSGYTNSTAAVKGAIGVDLGFFRDISIDAANNRMTIGGGVNFSDIFDPLHSVGKEMQTGSCSCVGVVGATLGGGVGPYQGLHGLILDALESATIITGSGEIVNASESENSDLFWGLRGAGQNFGIVTSATYQIHDQTNGGVALNGDFIFAKSDGETIFNLIKTIQNNGQPNELSMFPSIMYDMQTNATVVMMSLIYVGPEEEGMQYLQPFIDNNPIRKSVGLLPWNKLIKENRFGADAYACLKGGNHAVYGLNVNYFDVATYVDLIDQFDAFYAQNPALIASLLVLELFPNAVTKSVPDDATAYPYRDSLGYMFLSFVFSDEATAAVAEKFALATRAKLVATGSKDGVLTVYVNYAHGDEGRVAWYSERKLPKLLSLKSRWDPKTLFNWTNGLIQ
ncbi:FAD binding domain-containing protein [Hypoxylon sp. FL1857]|nr:FAD binding domain-containing protein [Hypoxylon sp. FL1857]